MSSSGGDPGDSNCAEHSETSNRSSSRGSSIYRYISAQLGWGPEQTSPVLDESYGGDVPTESDFHDQKDAARTNQMYAQMHAQPNTSENQSQARRQGDAEKPEKRRTGKMSRLQRGIYSVSSAAYEASSSGRAWVSAKLSSNPGRPVGAAESSAPVDLPRQYQTINTSQGLGAGGASDELPAASSTHGSGDASKRERQDLANSSSASAVASAALTAAAAYMPSYPQGLEAWQQSWDASKGEYWAYEMGYRMSSKAIGAMSSSLSYAGALLPWSASAGGETAARDEASSESKTATVGDIKSADDEDAGGMASNGAGQARRQHGRQDQTGSDGASNECKMRRKVEDAEAAGFKNRDDPDAVDSTLSVDNVAVSLGLSSGSMYSYINGASSVSRDADVPEARPPRQGSMAMERTDRGPRKKKRDAVADAAKIAASSMRPAAFESESEAGSSPSDSLDESTPSASDSFLRYMEDLAFWRMDWWSSPSNADDEGPAINRDMADAQVGPTLGENGVEFPKVLTAPSPGPLEPRPAGTEVDWLSQQATRQGSESSISESGSLGDAEPWAPWLAVGESAEASEGVLRASDTVKDGGEESREPPGLQDGEWARDLMSILVGSVLTGSEQAAPNLEMSMRNQTSAQGRTGTTQDEAIGELLTGLFDGMSPLARPPERGWDRNLSGGGGGAVEPDPAVSLEPDELVATEIDSPTLAGPAEAGSSFALASSSTGSLADSVIRVLNTLGLDAGKYEQRLEEAQMSLLQSIGVGGAEPLDGYDPDWASQDSPFDAGMAALLAHAAFESYNNPAGGKWETHPDGTRSAYLSPDFIREIYDGILTIQIRNLSFEASVDDDASDASTSSFPAETSWADYLGLTGRAGPPSITASAYAAAEALPKQEITDADAGVASGVLPSAVLKKGTKTIQTQRRKAVIGLALPNSRISLESDAEASVKIARDGKREKAVMDFQNRTLFFFAKAAQDSDDGSHDLVIKAEVRRSGGSTAFAYLSGEETEMEGRAKVSLSKLQSLQVPLEC